MAAKQRWGSMPWKPGTGIDRMPFVPIHHVLTPGTRKQATRKWGVRHGAGLPGCVGGNRSMLPWQRVRSASFMNGCRLLSAASLRLWL